MFDFESDDPDHLSFARNEILTVVKMEESGWWAAMRPEGDRLGWIPSSFVERLTETAVEEPYQEDVHPWIHDPEESNARNSESVSDSECIQLGDILSSVSDVAKVSWRTFCDGLWLMLNIAFVATQQPVASRGFRKEQPNL